MPGRIGRELRAGRAVGSTLAHRGRYPAIRATPVARRSPARHAGRTDAQRQAGIAGGHLHIGAYWRVPACTIHLPAS